jgi:hypothetical protein
MDEADRGRGTGALAIVDFPFLSVDSGNCRVGTLTRGTLERLDDILASEYIGRSVQGQRMWATAAESAV